MEHLSPEETDDLIAFAERPPTEEENERHRIVLEMMQARESVDGVIQLCNKRIWAAELEGVRSNAYIFKRGCLAAIYEDDLDRVYSFMEKYPQKAVLGRMRAVIYSKLTKSGWIKKSGDTVELNGERASTNGRSMM